MSLKDAAQNGAASATKACCAAIYASDWVRLLLGDSFHPGGVALTERLGVLLGLHAGLRLLDVAAGRGTSALQIAQRFGCQVVGVDYALANVEAARGAAAAAGLADRVEFVQADAEDLSGLADASFDAVICECAFCTFPDKATAGREIRRVLRPGGRFGLSDLTRSGPLPSDLEGLLAWIACLAGAHSVDEYIADLRAGGLSVVRVEAHDDALAELVQQVRARLLVTEVAVQLRRLALPGADLAYGRELAAKAAAAVAAGNLGYALIVAAAPSVG